PIEKPSRLPSSNSSSQHERPCAAHAIQPIHAAADRCSVYIEASPIFQFSICITQQLQAAQQPSSYAAQQQLGPSQQQQAAAQQRGISELSRLKKREAVIVFQ
ncbi:hypothetical protein Dimus_024648, partial [Dionaea muscipula]